MGVHAAKCFYEIPRQYILVCVAAIDAAVLLSADRVKKKGTAQRDDCHETRHESLPLETLPPA